MNQCLNEEPKFLKSVDLMVDRAINTLDLPVTYSIFRTSAYVVAIQKIAKNYIEMGI